MSHWAEINENNIVIRVTVGKNDDPDEGYQCLVDNLGGTWLQTSYNTHACQHLDGGTPFRGNFAGLGFSYREDLDAFIPPMPEVTDEFPAWVLNEQTFQWEPAEA